MYQPSSKIIVYILNMIFVGFLEEIIFRGFLFQKMAKDNVKSAIIVSSITFAVGHIVNLFNGENLIPTLLQICYSLTIGYLFVIILINGKSLWPCIITHSLMNAFSVFYVENNISLFVGPILLILISVFYTIYLKKHKFI